MPALKTPCGYAHPDYAGSLSEFGAPRELPRSGGWILERAIEGTAARDAMGSYPLFACRDWSRLDADLEELAPDLVSLALVADPFGDHDEALLAGCFDRVVTLKPHFVAELDGRSPEDFVKRTHQKSVRRALKRVDVELCDDPPSRLDEWVALFDTLSERHGITGLRAFSRAAFARQLAVPGLVMFEARAGDELVGLDLWYVDGDAAHGHLAAFSERGYELMASYATKWVMLQHFTGRVRFVDLGGAAGAGADDGLTRFKRGWSTTTRPAFFCARVFQPDTYADLAAARGQQDTRYFPAYRDGEFL